MSKEAAAEEPSARTRVEELEDALRKALDEERYEDAARLRDELNNLKRGLEDKSSPPTS
jgi:protein-arginine kinase activator protein McsA